MSGLAPDTFFGEGLVAHLEVTADAADIDSNRLEDAFGRNLQNRDIVVIAARGEGATPSLTAQAAQWLFVRGAKLVALADGISVGRDTESDDERVILSTLLENDVPVVRGLVNTETLSTERMAFMALPAPAADVTAWPVRFVALDPGLDPTQESVEREPDVDIQPDEPAVSESTPEPPEPDAATEPESQDAPTQPDLEDGSPATEASSDEDEDHADSSRQSTEA